MYQRLKQHIRQILSPLSAGSQQADLDSYAKFELLFDPQTSGGLLSGISADKVASCLAALKRAGYAAAVIGKVTSGSPMILLSAH